MTHPWPDACGYPPSKEEHLDVTQSVLSAGDETYVGDADTTVDRKSCGQVFVEAIEPRPVHFIHQLSHPDHLWKAGDLKTGWRGVKMEGGKEGGTMKQAMSWGRKWVREREIMTGENVDENGERKVKDVKMRHIMQQSEVQTDVESNRSAHFN